MPVIRADVANLADFIADNLVGDPTSDNLADALQAYMQATPNVEMPLSNVSVDYENNLAEIEAVLAAQPTWRDTINAGVGQTIIQMLAAALTYNQFAIVRAAQETMLPVSIIPSSIYTATQHLGVRLSRRIPAGMSATITRISGSGALTVPAYSQFVAGNIYLFNREPLIFADGVTSIAGQLYEGQVQSTSVISDGTPYQLFEFGGNDYTISDIDVQVQVNHLNWTRAAYQQYFSIGLWEYDSAATVFWDETTPDGNVKIMFGNGINGVIPNQGAIIDISFATTNGAQGNVDLTSATLACTSLPAIAGVITSAASNGSNEKDANEYRTLAPGLFFAKYRAVNRADHAAIARRYPGVVDAIFEGQQELHPTDLNYMMVMRATVLSNPSWGLTSSQAWEDFIDWFSQLGLAGAQILPNNPSAVSINITANIYVKPAAASLTSIQQLITANLRAAFALRAGVLGYSRYISDIEAIIKNSDPSIDYFTLASPATDTVINIHQYVTLNTITLNMAYSQRGTLS